MRFGPDAGVPAGYARCVRGARLFRGHSPDRDPAWFGPAIGARGTNRWDHPLRETAADPGVCYLAPTLTGVLLERVVRDVRRDVLSLATLRAQHAVTQVTTTRDLLLIDLLIAPWTAHGLQVHDTMSPPPYATTQQLSIRLAGLAPVPVDRGPPMRPDGILYGSRFGAGIECLALWDRAADALQWETTESIGSDVAGLAAACLQLGIGLVR